MSERRLDRVLAYVQAHPWAILPEKLAEIRAILELHVAGNRLTEEELQARLNGAAPAPRAASRTGAIAVVPVFGVLSYRINMLSEMSGGTSSERLAQTIRKYAADPEVGTIVLDVDSPGGCVAGIQELWDEIMAARETTKVVAVANALMASAAYYLASAADEIVATPSAFVGAIGVYDIHVDRSKAEEMAGVKTTLIAAGKYKVEGNPFEALSDEARAAKQAQVDEAYDMFIKAVAKGRGVTAGDVRSGFGEGRVLSAKAAKAEGMVDRVDTLEATLTRLAGRRGAAVTGAVGTGAQDLRASADDICEPDEDGECPDGYTLGEDGMCHLSPAAAATTTADLEALDLRRRQLRLRRHA